MIRPTNGKQIAGVPTSGPTNGKQQFSGGGDITFLRQSIQNSGGADITFLRQSIQNTIIREKDDSWLVKRLFETDQHVCEYASRAAILENGMLDDALYENAVREAWRLSFEPRQARLTQFQIWRMRANVRASLMMEGSIL